MPEPRIPIPHDQIAALCRNHSIRRLALFGSVIRDDFSDDSDVDVMVEFEPGKTPGLKFFAIARELSALFGRRADLLTPAMLKPEARERILASAHIEYDGA